MIPILFEILSTEPRTRGADVHFYTAELLSAIKPTWDKMEADELAKNPSLNRDEYRLLLKRMYPAGAVSHITLYDDSLLKDGQALSQHIISCCPTAWLEIKHNALLQAPDMSMLEALKGKEIQTTLNPTTQKLDVMLPVKIIGK